MDMQKDSVNGNRAHHRVEMEEKRPPSRSDSLDGSADGVVFGPGRYQNDFAPRSDRRFMAPIRRLVVDVLKPYNPSTLEFTQQVAAAESVAGATATLIELDQEVQNVKLTVEGEGIEYDDIEAIIEDAGGTVHSVDQVACGEYIVEDTPTPQD